MFVKIASKKTRGHYRSTQRCTILIFCYFLLFSLQVDDVYNFSGGRENLIPKHLSADDNHTDPPYRTRVVMPTHRKQSKRRRKKGRNRKRKLRIKNRRKISENKVNEKLNLILEPRKNRDAKSSCSDCKIRKRKGRKLNNGKISPQILRKILEKVADDTLSGARAGDGTITSILEDANQDRSGKKQKENGWSYNQHWMNVANGNDLVSDRKGYRFGKLSPNFYMHWR